MLIENYSYPPEFSALLKEIQKEYGVNLRELDGIGRQLDVNEFSKEFFSKRGATADVSVDSNSNVEDVTVLQYASEISKPVQRLNSYFLLWKYAKQMYNEKEASKIVRAQLTKEIYINDFHTLQTAYCFNFSCMDVVYNGLPFTRKVKSMPAKNLSSFFGQMINFITYGGNNIAGACGVADLLVAASWFVDKLRTENPSVPKDFLDKQIRQEIQSFIYSVNQPFRGGVQSFFTNISLFDNAFLDKICEEYTFPDFTKPNKATIQELQEIYVSLMNEILEKAPATFPVTTACFGVDDKGQLIDKTFLKFVAKHNLQFGFMNIYSGKTSTFSSCCRLRSDSTNDVFYSNSFGAGSTKIGSVGVVTVNLPRLAYTSKDREDFLEKVQKYAEMSSKINNVKRHIIKKRIDGGHYPLYTLGFMDLKKQYSTCGLVGVNEAVEILGLSILEKEGQQLVLDLLDIINKVNSIQEKKYRYPHNVEQVPAENSAIKLAEADKLLGLNKKYDIYSNQFIPLVTEADMYDRIKLQGMFDKHMTGGAICHLNIVDRIENQEYMERLIEHAIQQGVVYFAVNYNLQECHDGHITVGKNPKCTVCGKDILNNFIRVVGFLVNTKNFHKVRRVEDYPNRVWYKSETLK
jgi:ribonucleoside-triphosphate reductase (formate)